jgi:thiol-disulfide isomerase/thioredoxin
MQYRWFIFIFLLITQTTVLGASRDTSNHIILYNATNNSIYISYFNNLDDLTEIKLLAKKETKISTHSSILIKINNVRKRPFIFYLKPGEQLRVYKDKQNEFVVEGTDSVRNNELQLLKRIRLTFGITSVWQEICEEDNRKIWDLIKQPALYEAFIHHTYQQQKLYIDSFAKVRPISREFRLYAEQNFFYELMSNKLELALIRKNIKDSLPVFRNFLQCDSCLPGHAYIWFAFNYVSTAIRVYSDSAFFNIAHHSSPKTRDLMLKDAMSVYYNINRALFNTHYNNFIVSVNDSAYKTYIENLQQVNNLENLLKSTDLLLSPNGDTIRLKTLTNKVKGKHIYIDFWASWCAPCIEGLPNTKAFEDTTPDVEVLYLSLDKNINTWKEYSKNLGLDERNTFLVVGNFNSPIAKRLQIEEIPRYIIISKSRKTTITRAPEAKDKKLKVILQNLN